MKRGLGRGLEALFPIEDKGSGQGQVVEIRLTEIEPSINQPRKVFDEAKLEELAQSIKDHGVIQPVILARQGSHYKIIAGERRWRAAKIARLETIPAIIKDVNEKKKLELSLIENLQREDLNPIEQAEALHLLATEHDMTQEQLAKAIGKSRSSVANTLRLLNLDARVRDMVVRAEISEGHARTLLTVDKDTQVKLAQEIVKKQLNVRDIEDLMRLTPKHRKARRGRLGSAIYKDIEERLKDFFGTKVCLYPRRKGGRIVVEYSDDEDLDRILEIIDK